MVRSGIPQKSPAIDVLVVGAGPAGLSAARTIKAAGLRVVLIDREKVPGKKACAGGLTPEAWRIGGVDDLSPPEFAEGQSALTVHTPLGRATLQPSKGPVLITLDRPRFQRHLLDAAVGEGVEVRLGERLLAIEGQSVVTSRGRFRFGALVGADGAASRVRRHLALPRGPVLRALQVRLPRDTRQCAATPAVWFDPSLMGTGYGWRFPYREELRVGLALPCGRSVKSVFSRWLSAIGVNPTRHRVAAGSVPGTYLGHRFGSLFLAGDAAGLASPFTGEGIYQALVSGREVAREIIDPAYRSEVIPALAGRHRRTLGLLSFSGMKHLLSTAPWVLRIPPLRRIALARYAGVTTH